MNYQKITKCDVVNGEEVGVVLWVSGCTCRCKGCYNSATWDFKSGIPYTPEVEQEILNEFDKTYNTRLTLSGGHPFEPQCIDECKRLCQKLKQKRPDVKIWAYSGWYWSAEEILASDIMQYIDVLVDGPFVAALFDEKLYWRGSSNQHVIDVPRTMQQKKLVMVRVEK